MSFICPFFWSCYVCFFVVYLGRWCSEIFNNQKWALNYKRLRTTAIGYISNPPKEKNMYFVLLDELTLEALLLDFSCNGTETYLLLIRCKIELFFTNMSCEQLNSMNISTGVGFAGWICEACSFACVC